MIPDVNKLSYAALAPAALFAALALASFILYRREKSRSGKLGALAAAVEEELARLKAAPQTHELRLERFDLLWFPTLTCSAADKTIQSVAVGLPHCKKCLAALKAQAKEWVCPGCGEKRPESVADMMVIDSVAKDAVKLFLERHRDYRQNRPT